MNVKATYNKDNKTTIVYIDDDPIEVRLSENDEYDPEVAIAYAIAKYYLGSMSALRRIASRTKITEQKTDLNFVNKFITPYGFQNAKAYTDVPLSVLKTYLESIDDVRSKLALIAINKNLTVDELFNRIEEV